MEIPRTVQSNPPFLLGVDRGTPVLVQPKAGVFYQSGAPIGLPSSGSVSAAGALTLTTPFVFTYNFPGIWLYFPANTFSTPAAAAAGFYYAAMTSASAGTVYLDSTMTQVLAGNGSYIQVTTEVFLPPLTVPGGALGTNGSMIISAQFSAANTGNNKTYRLRYAGGAVYTLATSGANALGMYSRLFNMNSSRRQFGFPLTPGVTTQNAPGTLDTSKDQLLQWALTLLIDTDFAVLEHQLYELFPQK